MKLFLCGGECEPQKPNVYKKLDEVIDNSKPILYIPLAMNPRNYSYDGCFDFIKEELVNVNVPNIELVKSFEELGSKDFNDYSVLYFDDGNEFRLLDGLKKTECFNKLSDYIDGDGVVFGFGAGSEVLGKSINTCTHATTNEVGLKDLDGLNKINGFALLNHYIESDNMHLLTTSRYEKILVLPDEDTIYIDDGKYEVIGTKPFYVFDDRDFSIYNQKVNRLRKYQNLKTPRELMEFMDRNIAYGWIDVDGGMHLNNLSNLEENYKTSSIGGILNSGVGTCIEQAQLIKNFFDANGFENKLFCSRTKNEEDKNRMHCFVLFKNNNIWYHFEHSDHKRKGIHPYTSVDDALNDISEYKNSEIIEIPDIPANLTFKEFNKYVNSCNQKRNVR